MSEYLLGAAWSLGRSSSVRWRVGYLTGLVAVLTAIAWGSPLRAADAAEPPASPNAASAKPYAACGPPTSTRAQCLAIIDPTPSFAAPAQGAGPALSVSPGTEEASPGCFTGEFEFCGSGADHGFSPQDLQSAYQLPSGTAGSGQTVAIVDAYDDPNAQTDMNVYRATYDLPPCESGCFSKVNQEGQTKYPAAKSNWSLEISLDLDMVSAACPKCNILLVESNDNTLENLGIAVNKAVSLGATEVSNSYAAREIEIGKEQQENDSKYYNHPGTPITVASGDDGYNNEEFEFKECSNCSPSYPAGLSTVMAVGGTTLTPSGTSGRGWSEAVWFYSGSGCTLYVAKPAWQTDEGCANRTDNDVAAEASSTTPVSVYDTYSQVTPGWVNVGGTSVSTPLMAGAIALESSATRSEGVEGIYKHPANWFDVTIGSNWSIHNECTMKYLCKGRVGYDGPSGVGTPDGGSTATPPSAVTGPASGVKTANATLNAVVDPEASETTYYFQYGATTLYSVEVPMGGGKASGYTAGSAVSQVISGLTPETLYHFRIVAKNANGTTYGADRVFSTGPKVFLSNVGLPGSIKNGPQRAVVDGYGNTWVSNTNNNRIEELSTAGEVIRTCGSTGSTLGQFKNPAGIAINPTDGYLYVSDSGNDRIEVLSPTCGFAETIGTAGSGNGELSDPTALAFGTIGQFSRAGIVVVDSGNNRLEEFTWTGSPGEFVATYGSTGSGEGQFMNPTDIIFAGKSSVSSENFYVVDSGNNRVVEVAEKGFGSTEKASFKSIEQFGVKGSSAGQFMEPTGIALDPTTGDLEVTDTGNDRVEEFLPSGAYAASFGAAGKGSEAFESPRGVAVNSNGDVSVVDHANSRVDVWEPSQTFRPEWRIAPTPNPSETANSYLRSVSCSSTTSCTAVGDYEQNKTANFHLTLAEVWNGAEWSLQSTPNPSGSKNSILYDVSCTSSAACTAIGYYQSSSGTYFSTAERWEGASWQLQSMPEPKGTLNSLLSGVSCASSSACMTVGWYENASAVEEPLAESWNGTKWSLLAMPAPTGAKASYPRSVSCASSTACTAAGDYVNSSGVYIPFAERWNGAEWTVQTMVTPTGAKKTLISSVSCTSATACVAAGNYLNSSGMEVTLAEAWNGTVWSVQSTPNPAESKADYLDGVSCSSSTACTAAGVSLGSAGKYVTLAESWNGIEWSVQSTPNDAKGEGWLSGDVSCQSTTMCAAVGNDHLTLAELYR